MLRSFKKCGGFEIARKKNGLGPEPHFVKCEECGATVEMLKRDYNKSVKDAELSARRKYERTIIRLKKKVAKLKPKLQPFQEKAKKAWDVYSKYYEDNHWGAPKVVGGVRILDEPSIPRSKYLRIAKLEKTWRTEHEKYEFIRDQISNFENAIENYLVEEFYEEPKFFCEGGKCQENYYHPWKTCSVCQNKYRASNRKLNRLENDYCGEDCRQIGIQALRKKVEKVFTCKNCSEEFTRKVAQSMEDDAVFDFCSADCEDYYGMLAESEVTYDYDTWKRPEEDTWEF